MESSQDFQEMVWHAQLGVFNMRGVDTLLFNQYAYSYIYLQAGHILFTLKSEVLNGAMKSILKRRRKKMTDLPFVNFFLFIINNFTTNTFLLLIILSYSIYLTFFENFNIIKNVELE